MPHSKESDVIIRWIASAENKEQVEKNHIDDCAAIASARRPPLATVDYEFVDLKIAVRMRKSLRDGHRVVYLSGSNSQLITEIKEFFKRHPEGKVEFRDC